MESSQGIRWKLWKMLEKQRRCCNWAENHQYRTAGAVRISRFVFVKLNHRILWCSWHWDGVQWDQECNGLKRWSPTHPQPKHLPKSPLVKAFKKPNPIASWAMTCLAYPWNLLNGKTELLPVSMQPAVSKAQGLHQISSRLLQRPPTLII